MPRYRGAWLRGDLVAGAVVAALAIPQALGYASIAGAPVEVGLYAVPVALVAYAVFGSSRQLVVGPVSTVSVLSGSFLASFGVAGTAQAASYTAALALGSGLVLVAAGFVRIGWMAEFLSKPIVTGFVLGLTVLVILNEVPHLVGLPTPAGRVVERVGALGSSVTRGEADLTTVAVSAVSLVVLFGGQRLAPRFPWGLLVLLGGLGASAALDLQARGVEVVGPVPRGLPTPGIPAVDPADLAGLLSAGAALALVGLAEGLSAARLFAARGAYRIDADQELVASGAANVASGLFGGLGVAGSLSKTAAVSDARGRTPDRRAGCSGAGPDRHRRPRPRPVGAAPGSAERDRGQRGLETHGLRRLAPLPPGAPQRHRRGSHRRGGRAGLRPPERPAAGRRRIGDRPGLPLHPGRRRGDGQGAP